MARKRKRLFVPRSLDESNKIKTALMEYFRYKKSIMLVCSEGINNADINALNEKCLIEVEIKISKQDFQKEFKTSLVPNIWDLKARKHRNYATSTTSPFYTVPNKFYFCVPEEISTWALEYLKDKNPKYGLLVYKNKYLDSISVLKQARQLHETSPNITVLKKVAKRLSSELIIERRKQKVI